MHTYTQTRIIRVLLNNNLGALPILHHLASKFIMKLVAHQRLPSNSTLEKIAKVNHIPFVRWTLEILC